ncbi:methionine ABC transporter permease [Synergistales bacterium]|nr:methionine ABC transporter permease [Synergistales bacterium]GHV54989.1 methionine ABC transporter permease [Synergistales bacterium]
MSQDLLELLADGLLETFYMVGASSAIAFLIGLPLGVILSISAPASVLPNRPLYGTLSLLVNIGRSVPFIILMVAIIPFTRLIVGTSIGTNAAVVPLAVSAIPFVGRVAESALREIDGGIIEAAQSMGATPFEIIVKVMLPEALPAMIAGATLTVINLIGYSAMAGAIGGGGLGDIAIRYGYQRFMPAIMLITVVMLVLMVQLFQFLGDKWSAAARHDRNG